MNAPEEQVKKFGLDRHMVSNERILKMLFGDSESLFSYDTYQFTDYSEVVADLFDPDEKAKRRRDVFPRDCKKAFEMGVRFTRKNG